MLVLGLGVAGLLSSADAVAGDEPIVAPEGTDQAEVEALQETVGRYSARMNEFKDEAKVMVDRQEAAERSDLNRSYDATLGQLQDDDDALRTTAIRRFESFLAQYPNATHSAHVMFRLSELYFEKSEESYAAADVEFQKALEILDEGGDLEDIPDEPEKDYSASIGLHTQIIERFPDYEYIPGSYYMLGYMLREPSAAQMDESAAVEWFQRIADEFPTSEFAPRAHLRLGDYHFEYNELDTAIPHYQRVVELEGVNGSLYDDGLYKLAWTHYRLSDYDQALQLLGKLLDWSETVWEPKKGQESSTVPEAVEYIAISLSDLALNQQRSPLQVAEQYFGRGSDGAYEARIYKQLADVLSKQANYGEAIEIYEYFQQRWPYDPDNPKFQQQVARLHVTKVPPDRDAANAAIATLNERFNDNSAWWRANRNNPDALSVARSFIEDSLAAVAINAHTKANESGAPVDYLKAAQLYGAYLQKFPFASDYYEIQWYNATVLQLGGDLSSAEREFTQLRKGGEHPFKESSLFRLRQISLQRVLDKFTEVEARDPAAKLREEVVLSGDKKRQVFELGTDHQALVSRSDELLQTDFQPTITALKARIEGTKDRDKKAALGDTLDSIEEYARVVSDNRAPLAYQSGQIYFAHGDFEEARKRLASVVEAHATTTEGCYAADLDARSYLQDDDLTGYRQKVAYYMSLNVCAEDGAMADADDSGIDFKNQIERVDFTLAARLTEAGQFIEAAEAFVKFTRTYPDSEFRKLALQNAANNYERGGRLDDSIRMLEQYVASYPDDDTSRRFLFRLAGVYAQALDLERAIQSYEQLYERSQGSDAKDAPIALANAAYLRVGIGDFAGAARNYETFGDAYPDQPDTEAQVFQAGAQWERVGPSEAMAFYKRYLAQYRGVDPEHEMTAVYKLAMLSEEVGARPQEVDTLFDDVTATYVRLLATGRVGGMGRHYAAHAEYRRLIEEFEAFRTIQFTSNDMRNAELLGAKAEELVAIEGKALGILKTYGDFEYGTAGLYINGEAYLAFADMLFDTPLPKGLDEDEVLLYEEAIAEQRIPLEDKGKSRLVRVIDTAKEAGRWSKFQTMALGTLNERFPREFAPEKEEARGTSSAATAQRAGPIPMRAKTEEESGEKGGEQ
jgi:tetratricopeptide (TPR) repeat protein